jgi:hypothetical protein
MKAAIVVLSDPNSGSDEALGRVFNALAAALDFKQHGDDVTVLFQGAGTRWVAALSDPDHPAHQLFLAVQDVVAGVSMGCADVFGAAEDSERLGVARIADNPVPGTSGLASLRRLSDEGARILTF